MSKLVNFFNSMFDSVCEWTITSIGTGIAVTGIVIKELAIVLIMLGILLWMYRITKVFRWGALGYLIGLILEILGSVMI